MSKKFVVFFAGLVLLMLALVTYAGSASVDASDDFTGPVDTVAQDGGDCTVCHNDSTIITGPMTAWEESGHGTGESYGRGSRSSCAACHSGGGFSAAVAAGIAPNEIEAGDPMPTRQDCRTCHNIHVTYTEDDWSLETTDPVNLYAFEGVTFDGGNGNLCANCHQSRRTIVVAEDGTVDVNSSHWGPHHGVEAATMMGVGAAGGVEGTPSIHAMAVSDTCVGCHVANADHSFEANLAVCQECHAEAESFDINGSQTQVAELIAELQEALVAKGMLEGDEEHGYHPVQAIYPEAEAAALWNYIYFALEDTSLGVHNPPYVIAALEASIEALQ